jgi:hypothetical protein
MLRRFAGWLMSLAPTEPDDDLREQFIEAIVASVLEHGRARTSRQGAERAWDATRHLFLSAVTKEKP